MANLTSASNYAPASCATIPQVACGVLFSVRCSACELREPSGAVHYKAKCMETKLTIELPEDLHRRAKAVAALRGETVSKIVRAALEQYIDEAIEEAEDVRAVQEIEGRIATGQERVYSHEEVWAEIESLESQGVLPD